MRPLSERDSDLHAHPGHPADNPDHDGPDATESGPWHDAPAHLRTDESTHDQDSEPDAGPHVPAQRDPDHDEPAAAIDETAHDDDTHDDDTHDEDAHDEAAHAHDEAARAHDEAAHAHEDAAHEDAAHQDAAHQDAHEGAPEDAAPVVYPVTPEPALPPAVVPVEPAVVPVAAGPGTAESGTAESDTAEPGPGTDGDLKPGDVPVTPVAAFLTDDVVRDLRERWRDAQLGFVDDPRQAAEDVRVLVNEAIDAFMAALSGQRDELNATAGSDTEQYRVAVRRYREFFDRLLNL